MYNDYDYIIIQTKSNKHKQTQIWSILTFQFASTWHIHTANNSWWRILGYHCYCQFPPIYFIKILVWLGFFQGRTRELQNRDQLFNDSIHGCATKNVTLKQNMWKHHLNTRSCLLRHMQPMCTFQYLVRQTLSLYCLYYFLLTYSSRTCQRSQYDLSLTHISFFTINSTLDPFAPKPIPKTPFWPQQWPPASTQAHSLVVPAANWRCSPTIPATLNRMAPSVQPASVR